jgi:WD40-like Beta Propeller Repeat
VAILSCSKEKGTNPDTIPPSAITDLAVRSTDQVFTLAWTAPGDDGDLGHAAHYDVRYAASNLQGAWNSATAISSPPTPALAGHADSVRVQGIGPGPWEFGVKTEDPAGNWSKVSNIVTSSLLTDTIPPADITDLTVRTTGLGHYLKWTAPGDDGTTGRASHYDIRYAAANLAANWDAATVVTSTPIPGPAGSTDSVAVLGIGWGPWEFGIKTTDNVGNESGISNVVVTTEPVDTTPPATVTDLAVDLLTERSIILTWTAVGNDGTTGQAAEYDLRYSVDPITPETWSSATRVQGMDPPGPSGTRETFTVTGLAQGTSYHFALVVLDDVQNPSGLSNQVAAAIPSPFQVASGADVYGPDWSPDGASIVFTRGSPRQLFVVPPSGGTPVQFTSASPAAQEPSWSPDGSRIAFDLYVDGGKRSVVALMSAQPYAAPQVLADHDTLFVMQPRWSPDGTEIVYALYGRVPLLVEIV